MDTQVKENVIEVPTNTGIDGFLHTIRSILKLPKVQAISIDARGKVTYKRVVTDGEVADSGLKVSFEELEPYYLVRNAEVEELRPESCNAGVILVSLLDRSALEGMHPIAFVTSPNSILREWYSMSAGSTLSSKNRLCGIPVLVDRQVPDTVLLLCLGYTKDAQLVDVHKTYKIEMDYGPSTDVEVIWNGQ